jgi:hypothetical protein
MTRRLALVALLLLAAPEAFAAPPVFDQKVSVGSANTSLSTLTAGSITPAGSNKLGIFAVGLGSSATAVSTTTPPSIGGSNATKKVRVAGVNDEANCELWFLVNPPSGTPSVTLDAAVFRWQFAFLTYKDVDQATPLGTAVTNTGTDTPVTVTVNTGASGDLIVDVAARTRDSFALTVGSGQTERENSNEGNNSDAAVWLLASDEAGAASVDMTWTFSSAALRWCTIGVPLRPVGVAPTGVRRRALLSKFEDPFFWQERLFYPAELPPGELVDLLRHGDSEHGWAKATE